jgi:hypothetical protein
MQPRRKPSRKLTLRRPVLVHMAEQLVHKFQCHKTVDMSFRDTRARSSM